MHSRTDEVFGKIGVLQQSIKVTVILYVFELVVCGLHQSLESTTITRPPIEYVPIPAILMTPLSYRENIPPRNQIRNPS